MALLAVISACRGHDAGPPMVIEEVELSLLARDDLRRVVEERSEHPVRVLPLSPGRSVPGDCTALPCLEMHPPSRVLIDLPALPEGAVLRFAAGFDKNAFEIEESGEVQYALDVDGQNVFRVKIPFGPDVPPKKRTWRRKEIVLEGARRLSVTTKIVTGPDVAVAAGFGLLEIGTQREVPRGRASASKPNVVFVLVDTLRADRLGAYGYELENTPRIDAFAEQGTLYERAFAASSWTFPSTASVLTSLSPPEHGLESHLSSFLAQEHLTLAEVFQQAGWTTAAWVVNPLVRAERDFDQGFETFAESRWEKAGSVVDKVSAWLDEHGEWRFFLYLHLGDPHEYLPSEPHRSLWAGPDPEGYSRKDFHHMNERRQLAQEYDHARFETYVAHLQRLYDATVAEVDTAFGRLLGLLEAKGLTEETLVVFTSDHGEAFLEHGMCHHGTGLFDELVCIPLILGGPGVPPGVRVAESVENRFVAPTLCELAGIEPRENLAGPSLLDLDGVRSRAAGPIFFSTHQGMWPPIDGEAWTHVGRLDAVRHDDLMLLFVPMAPEGGSIHALYDLAKDPEARLDVSAAHAEEVERMTRAIADWQAEGASERPVVFGGGEEIEDLMQELGYMGPDDTEGGEQDE